MSKWVLVLVALVLYSSVVFPLTVGNVVVRNECTHATVVLRSNCYYNTEQVELPINRYFTFKEMEGGQSCNCTYHVSEMFGRLPAVTVNVGSTVLYRRVGDSCQVSVTHYRNNPSWCWRAH